MASSFGPMTVAHQAPWCMGFSRQKYWEGLPWPPPGDLPDQGPLHLLHWQAGSLSLSPPGKPTNQDIHSEINIEWEKQLVRLYIPKKSRINCPSYTFKTYVFLRTYCPLISMHIKIIRNILRIHLKFIIAIYPENGVRERMVNKEDFDST